MTLKYRINLWEVDRAFLSRILREVFDNPSVTSHDRYHAIRLSRRFQDVLDISDGKKAFPLTRPAAPRDRFDHLVKNGKEVS